MGGQGLSYRLSTGTMGWAPPGNLCTKQCEGAGAGPEQGSTHHTSEQIHPSVYVVKRVMGTKPHPCFYRLPMADFSTTAAFSSGEKDHMANKV